MSLTWGSKPTPEERAADKADRAASRDAINRTRIGLQEAVKRIKVYSAKEDYPVIQKIIKDMLDWLKAHPDTNQDDINDYSTNTIQQNPLIQSMDVRWQWSNGFTIFDRVINERIKSIAKKQPKLVDTANQLLTPVLAYRDTLLTWFNNGQTKLLPQDYEDKAVEIKEAATGEDGKEDKFKIRIFMDDNLLKKEMIARNVDNNTINIKRLIGTIFKITFTIIVIVIICWGSFLGASYATNLNIYRSFAFRLFYAIYGALFFLWVVPYELIYKKWWLGESLKMHGYIPLFDGPVTNWSWIGKNIFFFLEKKPIVDMEG